MNIKISEKELRNMINKSMKEILFESSLNILSHGDLSNHGEVINIGTIIDLDSRDKFLRYATEMWQMLQLSYEQMGGLKTYRNYQDFISKKHFATIVVDDSKTMLACEIYRLMDNSFKIVAYGCNQTEEGKMALQQLVQQRIINFDLCYWSEVSGAIEHYFKKYNGYPMPNTMASEILSIPKEKITLSNDSVHYTRPIGPNGELFEKMIFGIKSEEIFEKVIKEIENYGSFMKEINTLSESVKQWDINTCVYIIENIYRAHEEDGFNELIPSWYYALQKCLLILKSMDSSSDRRIQTYIEYTEYLLQEMPVLQLHQI